MLIHRTPWCLCPCCPPNVARTVASVGGHFYSTGAKNANDAWVHLYGQSNAELVIGSWLLGIRQVTQYPWAGLVRFELSLSEPKNFTLHLRVPGWCNQWSLKINGTPITNNQLLITSGYLSITRTWHPSDVVEFDMAMPVQTVYAHPSVRQMQGRAALQRGPLVYCLEGADHNGAQLERISVDANATGLFTVEHHADLLGGVSVIRGVGTLVDDAGWDGLLYRHTPSSAKPIEITAIPYYAWDNREAGEMRVWLRTN